MESNYEESEVKIQEIGSSSSFKYSESTPSDDGGGENASLILSKNKDEQKDKTISLCKV